MPGLDCGGLGDVVAVAEAFAVVVDGAAEGLQLLEDWVVEFGVEGFAAGGESHCEGLERGGVL